MAGIDGLRLRLRLLRSSEQGMALPFALFATIATMALAGAAVMSSIDVQQGSHRDSNAKSAIAAADAGAGVAMMRLNRYADSLTNASNQNCIGVSAEGTLVLTGATNGWCPAITGTVGGSTYSYRVSAMVAGATMSIVSTGTAGGVGRRVDVTLGAESVGKILKEEGLVGEAGIKIPGNPHVRVNIGTNGNIETEGQSWEICGSARHGVGGEGPSEEELSCEGEEEEENISLPPVSSFIPPDIKTENSNSRLMRCVAPEPEECEKDPYQYGKRTATHPFDSERRSITLSGNDTLTLGGEKPYWLCQLTLSGSSHLIMGDTAHVAIYFDTPEDCGLSSSEPQISMGGNTNIEATGYNAELGQYDMLNIYMLGGPTSRVELNGTTGSNDVILYAPDTDIDMKGSATYKGVIAGRTLEINGNPTFEQDAGFEPQEVPGNTLYSRQSYVECSGTAVSAPDENC
jgi:hypothetical protein